MFEWFPAQAYSEFMKLGKFETALRASIENARPA